MAELFFIDERTVFLVPFWMSIVYVMLQDAGVEQSLLVEQTARAVGVVVLLTTMVSLHFDYFPELKQQEIDLVGGHASFALGSRPRGLGHGKGMLDSYKNTSQNEK